MEPDLNLLTEPINEEIEELMNSQRALNKDDKDFIAKNMKVYNAYEGKFIKPNRSLAASLQSSTNKSKSKENLQESKSSQKLHKISGANGSKKRIHILEKQTKEIDNLTIKLSNSMSKLNKSVPSDMIDLT